MEVNNGRSVKSLRDHQLVKDILESGSREAYSELLNLYFDQVYRRLLKMTGEPLDAEDLTMEAFSKAFNNLQRYTGEFAFSTWLYRIARNHCIDFLRRRKNDPNNPVADNIPDPGTLSEIPSAQPGPEEALIRSQESRFLFEIVRNLKPNYKHIVEMYYFSELSVEEISGQLGIPENTVKIRLFRARELLLNKLTRET